MPETTTFVVLEGLLTETMEFEVFRGYEQPTSLETERGASNGVGLEARLLGVNGDLLQLSTPEVRFPLGCSVAGSRSGVGLVRAVLPRHPDAKVLTLAVNDRVLFAAHLDPKPPTKSKIVVGRTSEAEITAEVNIGRAKPDNVQLFLVTAGGRRFQVGTNVGDGKHVIDLSSFAGRGEGSLELEVSRGFRTTTTRSKEFGLPEPSVHGRIISPVPETVWSYGERGSLIGNLFDDAGRKVDWNSRQPGWSVDGRMLNDTLQIAATDPLDSGTHHIALVLVEEDGQPTVLSESRVEVLAQSQGQKDYAAALASYRQTAGDADESPPDLPD